MRERKITARTLAGRRVVPVDTLGRYDCFMVQDQGETVDFPEYLKSAIEDAGFATPTQFARKAKVEPSVLFTWLDGKRRPTIRLIERFAPTLGIEVSAVVAAAYPEATATKPAKAPPRRQIHPLADEVDRLLRDDSPLADDERQRVIVVVEAGIAQYRSKLRRRSSRAS